MIKITICDLKVTNFLDITLNLNNGKYYYTYRKPNERSVYIHKDCNHGALKTTSLRQ